MTKHIKTQIPLYDTVKHLCMHKVPYAYITQSDTHLFPLLNHLEVP